MTSGVSSVSAIDTAVKVKSSTSNDDGSGATTQLAALQKQLSQLQNQLKKVSSSGGGEGSAQEIQQITAQITSVQTQIEILQRQADEKAQKAQQRKVAEESQVQPPDADKSASALSREQSDKQSDQRDAAARARAIEAGSALGTQVDTYA